MREARKSTPGRKLRASIAAAAMGGALLFSQIQLSQAGGNLPKPASGEIVLTIGGAITKSNGDGQAFFDLALLKSLPSRQIVTDTPWTKGQHTFTGVPLKDLMDWVGATGQTITANALNDYAVDLPVSDGEKYGALVVYLYDGQPMLPSDRGPVWLLYPFSERPETRSETFYQRAVWNLYTMTVH